MVGETYRPFSTKKNMTDPMEETEADQQRSAIFSVRHEAARAAIRRIRFRAEQREPGRFVWSEWRAYRDEGRGVT
jgi:hypothetical protein